ncbi:MAG: hypothetical protein EU533_06800 [Promethearchaeota archaeon]|nr:MAG: hypothetical protein EU533_06800 [Candidatus Lokiarchaeota archaeon]
MTDLDLDELIRILPKLVRENDTIKGAIISALSGVVATHEDIVELNKQMDKRFEAMQEQMDKRFEAMQEQMDKRFEAMDKRFEAMDKRFEAMDRRFEAMNQKMDTQFTSLKTTLEEIRQTIGKPFEQFARNVIIRLLKSEGYLNVKLKRKKFIDSEKIVSDTTDVEIDGFSQDPAVIVEITSILHDEEKVDRFLKKKRFVEEKFDMKFKGFFVAASTDLESEKMADITIKLRDNGSELINL